jgi:plasmid maintenance system antidote protein VapI
LDGFTDATIVGKENVDSGKFVILGHENWTINLSIQAKVQQTMPKEIMLHRLFKTSLEMWMNM